MAKIETADAAQRLAAALLSDIRLYNAEEIANGEDLSEIFSEARALYQSRVIPQLHATFEQTIASSGLNARPQTAQPDEPSTHAVTTHATPSTTESSSSNLIWIAFGLLGLTATIIWRLLR